MKTNKSGVLLVVPCLNEEAHIERLVLQMVNAAWSRPMRIVVADGGSTDRTREIAQDLATRFDNVSYLFNAKRLQSAAVNAAVAAYGQGAAFVIRLDAHAAYPQTYCQDLIEEAEANQADSVVVPMETIGSGWFQSGVAAAQNSKLGNGGSAHRCAHRAGCWVDHGHHALMRIEAFRAVDGYDETFSHNEDAELDVRLARAGYRIWLTGRTSLQYFPRSAPLPLFVQYVKYGHGRVRTLQKHKVRPKLRQVAPAAVVPAACLSVAAPMLPAAALPLLAWMLLCLGYGALLGVRSRRAPVALAGVAAMIMHFGWSLGFWRAVLAPTKARPARANDNDKPRMPFVTTAAATQYIVPANAVAFMAGSQANDIEQTNATAISR
jgi:succinoglycan biosynthesis protein ExoA